MVSTVNSIQTIEMKNVIFGNASDSGEEVTRLEFGENRAVARKFQRVNRIENPGPE